MFSNSYSSSGVSLILLIGGLVFSAFTGVQAQSAPEPPEGTRWIVNNDFTDEFNGTQLDQEKWFNYHPRWVGRQPAIFLPRQVSVDNGMLQIRNTRLEQDTVVTFFDGSTGTYSIGGGAVVSQKIEAYHGYYEVRMRASDISMSSTFWMSNPRTQGDCPNYSLELDIVEAIGGAKNFPSFATSMKSNTHYFQTACDGGRQDFASGGEGPIGGDASEAFHRYGCWWQDENNMIFYLDGEESHRISANTGASPRPFDRPMHINMVTETYNWEQPPTDEELADDNRNATFYDYIHAYTMLDVDAPTPVVGARNLVVNPG
ncbi:MAG: family 16 glycosylhydrolase, partial [Bacteroidota bacterium]